MGETCSYKIKVGNGVDVISLNAESPLQVYVARIDADATCLATQADQSALIGLLRYLHQQGYILLSVIREL